MTLNVSFTVALALGSQLTPLSPSAPATLSNRILVMPFENVTRNGRIFWLGEASAVLLADDLNALGSDAITREERRHAFERLQVPPAAALTDATVIRMPKTYPAYFGAYSRFGEIREFVDSIENLFLIGRNGMHKYNNQDHAMMTAMLTARNILAGERIHDVWDVNEDAEYHEAGSSGARQALKGERFVPQRVKQAASGR